jgi:hypothetical protein
LPFDDKPVIPRWKRVWLLIVAVLSVAGIAAMSHALKFQDADEAFGAFVVVLFVVSGVASGIAGLYPEETSRKFAGFARLSAVFSTIILLLATALGVAGWQAGPYI